MSKIWFAFVAAIGFAAGATADEQHQFVSVGRVDSGVFVDLATLRDDGREVVVDVLWVYPDYDSKQRERPLLAQVRQHRVACDWRAHKGAFTSRFYDASGELTLSKGVEVTLQMSFYGNPAFDAAAFDKACEKEGGAPATTFGSVKDVLAFAAKTKRPDPGPPPVSAPPSKVSGPQRVHVPAPAPIAVQHTLSLPEFADISNHRFGVVTRDATAGHALFLDWSNLKRDGDSVVALTLSVLRDETEQSPAAKFRPTFALRSMRYDCKARTMAMLGEAFASRDLRFHPLWKSDMPAQPVGTSPIAAAGLDAACAGQEREPTYAGVAEAVAFARDSK